MNSLDPTVRNRLDELIDDPVLLCDPSGSESRREFTQKDTAELYLQFLEEICDNGRFFTSYTRRENKWFFVLGAGVAKNLTTPAGTPVLPPVEPRGVAHDLRTIAGNDWGSAPTWKQLLARVSLMLADENQMGILDTIFAELNVNPITNDALDAASAIIHGAFSVAQHKTAIRDVIGLLEVRNPELAKILHRFNTMITTVNYDHLVTNALQNRRDPVSLNDLERHPARQTHRMNTTAVFHLHGQYTDSDSSNGFTLFPAEYADIDNTVKMISLIKNAMRDPASASVNMILVGADGTIDDIHFKALWYVLGKQKSGGGDVPWFLPHIVLVKGGAGDEVGKFPNPNNPFVEKCRQIYNEFRVPLVPVVYGMDYPDLNGFLKGNLPPSALSDF